jgi:hypothetical protein
MFRFIRVDMSKLTNTSHVIGNPGGGGRGADQQKVKQLIKSTPGITNWFLLGIQWRVVLISRSMRSKVPKQGTDVGHQRSIANHRLNELRHLFAIITVAINTRTKYSPCTWRIILNCAAPTNTNNALLSVIRIATKMPLNAILMWSQMQSSELSNGWCM